VTLGMAIDSNVLINEADQGGIAQRHHAAGGDICRLRARLATILDRTSPR